MIADVPPLLSSQPPQNGGRRSLALLLSFCLYLFLADAVFSVLDDVSSLLFDCHIFSALTGISFVVTLLMVPLVYVLIGLTPMVPKRLFLPIPLFYLGEVLAAIPLTIYFYGRHREIDLIVSICQAGVGLAILCRAQGGLKFRWPALHIEQLGARGFSWRHFSGFVLVNLFVLLPLAITSLLLFTAHAVNHFSEGFMALRPVGFTVQVRKYVRDDGKVIELFPMAHVASPDFYRRVSRSFPSNSVILMEGVSDDHNLLTNKISYKRMAKNLGLAEQKIEFVPAATNRVFRADVDVGQFSKPTLDFLNLVMMIHAKGVTAENLSTLMRYSPAPDFESQLFDDILIKRNQHLLEEIQLHLKSSDNLMVPWGVAHMPAIAREIQKAGFHLRETREFVVIRFRKSETYAPPAAEHAATNNAAAGAAEISEKAKTGN
jgi:hypothetical protein